MTLYSLPDSKIIYKGKEYKIFSYYNRILYILEEVIPSELPTSDIVDISLSLLVDGAYPIDGDLLKSILDHILGTQQGQKQERIFDFVQDANLIYAAFYQAYGIDLHTQIDVMSWSTFYALFCGLPDSTRFMAVVRLRQKPVPKITPDNADAVAALIQAKQAVSLQQNPEDAAESFYTSLRGFANRLRQM